MTFVHGLRKGVRNAGTDADQGGLLDAELRRDLVGRAEANAADVASQPVRIFRDHSDGVGTVRLVDANRPRRAYAIAMQEQHDRG